MDLVARAEEIVGWFDRDLVDRRFEVRSRPDLPAALADPLRVGQVVTNLVSNACKYSDASTPVVVEVDLLDPRTLALNVVDQGVGIPPDELDRIFEQFHRLEPPDLMQTSGIGLGLYIARHLAIAMDGDLQVESEVGVGSRFTLHLPVSTTPVAQPHDDVRTHERAG
jgi:signal transduction histidine kinase